MEFKFKRRRRDVSVGLAFCGVLLCCAILSHFYKLYNKADCGDASVESLIKGPIKADDPRLIAYVKDVVLEAPSILPYALQRESSMYTKRQFGSSWTFIFRHIQKLFHNYTNGVFVEAGGLDGEFLSNTLWLEMTNTWTGLLVEPDPSNFDALRKKNRKCWIANACLSKEGYPKLTVFSSLLLADANLYEFHYRWIVRGSTHAHYKGSDSDVGSGGSFFFAQCYPLETFLLALDLRAVDLFTLDIQGGEFEVLKMFPWSKVTVKALVVEYYLDPVSLIAFIESKGLTLWAVSKEPDYVFVNVSDTHIQQVYSKFPRGILSEEKIIT